MYMRIFPNPKFHRIAWAVVVSALFAFLSPCTLELRVMLIMLYLQTDLYTTPGVRQPMRNRRDWLYGRRVYATGTHLGQESGWDVHRPDGVLVYVCFRQHAGRLCDPCSPRASRQGSESSATAEDGDFVGLCAWRLVGVHSLTRVSCYVCLRCQVFVLLLSYA